MAVQKQMWSGGCRAVGCEMKSQEAKARLVHAGSPLQGWRATSIMTPRHECVPLMKMNGLEDT